MGNIPVSVVQEGVGLARILFIISGIIPVGILALSGYDTMLCVYTIFVASYLLIPNLVTTRAFGTALRFFSLFLISGTLTEILAWLSGYLAGKPFPEVFHPQLIPDIIIGFGYYGGMAVAWILVLRRFRFSLVSAMIVAGAYGVFAEQDGAIVVVVLQGLAVGNLGVILLGLYVFVVYASFTGIAFAPFMRHFDSPTRSSHWLRFLLVPVLLYVFTHAGVILIFVISEVFGGLPESRSALKFPLWS